MNELMTVRDISRRLDVPLHRLKYAIEVYDIQPRQRVGIIRQWAEEDLPTIEAAVRRVAGRRGGSHAN